MRHDQRGAAGRLILPANRNENRKPARCRDYSFRVVACLCENKFFTVKNDSRAMRKAGLASQCFTTIGAAFGPIFGYGF